DYYCQVWDSNIHHVFF
nr:immunoglobulin light chain junction region [Macaca mulatta]MOW15067.1 immunoglobulin light chain junction region [Macaca mulatta]MOW15450.1 immunoglobulin light chain junction region [Macaca mulatta]MOW15520.1 immunoglobulin light chain junction region [Macaca mulatta]MOW15575.1 immunoglobulin light chain junction region [Macaca mulatta]